MTDYKKDFPLLSDRRIAYLDNAATAQRPLAVLAAEKEFYEKYNANPLRGLYRPGAADETVTCGTGKPVPYNYRFQYRQNRGKRAINDRPTSAAKT